MEQIDLGDKRLEVKAVNILNTLGSRHLETIPLACQGCAETAQALNNAYG